MASTEQSVRAAALTPPQAHGFPLAPVQLRLEPEDFRVEEELGFAPAGAGAHVLLKVRKVNANTQWVARELARLAGCRPAEVGYAGLKDRRAVALQWFSLPRPRTPLDWAALRTADFAVLEAHAHTRKLPRGALSGNRFAIRLHAPAGGAALAAALAPRLAAIARRGVPNYFGPQRFGRDGANLARSAQELRTLPPQERGFVLSAARSVLFNALLAERVAAGSWERLLPGDLANLEGRGSLFAVPAEEATLAQRCEQLQIHPTGPLWGRGALSKPRVWSPSLRRRSPRASPRNAPPASKPACARSGAACGWPCMSCARPRSPPRSYCTFAWVAAALPPRCCAS